MHDRVPRRRLSCFLIGLAGCLVITAAGGIETPRLPEGFVHLREIDRTIVQDIRYATAGNFTGTRVDGYRAGECILLREAAEALRLVQDDLRARSLSLKVYDCYRPVRAVTAFMQWVQKPPAPGEERYSPRVRKAELVKLRYIAANSVHSTGAAVDLTLTAIPVAAVARFDPKASYAACNAARAAREPDNSLDMGTSFDCFDEMSYTESTEITTEQRKNRRLLVDAMSARTFKNYSREWWHFTFVGLPGLPKAQDFVITR